MNVVQQIAALCNNHGKVIVCISKVTDYESSDEDILDKFF